MSDIPPFVTTIVDESMDRPDIETLQRLLEQYGLAPDVEATYSEGARERISWSLTRREGQFAHHYHEEAPSWTVVMNASVNALASRLGAPALRELVEAIQALRAAQTGTSPSSGLVLLVDEDTGVRLDLGFQLPLRAFSDLATVDLSAFNADPLRFHRKSGSHGKWRAPH